MGNTSAKIDHLNSRVDTMTSAIEKAEEDRKKKEQEYSDKLKTKEEEYSNKEKDLQEKLSNQADKSEAELAKVRADLDALREARFNERDNFSQGVLTLQRQYSSTITNIVASSKGESLNAKRDIVIRILSGLRGDCDKMDEWSLDGRELGEGMIILKYFKEHSRELVKEIKKIKEFVCRMTMADAERWRSVQQQIVINLESILKPAIDLDNEVRKARFDLKTTPESFTIDGIMKCLEMVEEAANAVPPMGCLSSPIDQCAAEESVKCQQNIDNAFSELRIND